MVSFRNLIALPLTATDISRMRNRHLIYTETNPNITHIPNISTKTEIMSNTPPLTGWTHIQNSTWHRIAKNYNNPNKSNHNKTLFIFYGIYSTCVARRDIRETSRGRHGVLDYRQLDCSFNSLFGLKQRKPQSSVLLAYCNSPLDSPDKVPMMRKAYACRYGFMNHTSPLTNSIEIKAKKQSAWRWGQNNFCCFSWSDGGGSGTRQKIVG